jgi:hypothetical protein|tara:strand:- start:758 stop:958 length:201 start_codon:yes stop_codon:yes gene_type:complete
MKNLIKLTEATLTRIVERVIAEENSKSDSDALGEIIKKLQANPDDEELKKELVILSKRLGIPTKEN